MNSQVGIGTTDPDASSILDIESNSQGLLVPRMATLQRTAIASPANSLIVYDTDLGSFYYYDVTTTSWVIINSGTNQRDNYKLIKSVADLAPELANGGGSKYLLNSNYYYEINGTITLAAPIDLNDAYLSGLDANEDILTRSSGPVFEGTKGGSIRNLTITGGGTAFNITGGASLLIQNTIIDGMDTVGTISGLQLFFGNIIQFINNSNGITYSDINRLLLSNQAWFSTNGGTYETFTGNFDFVQKASGFSTVDGTSTAMDFSSNPSVNEGILLGTVFSGTGLFINKYTTGTYPGYNFTVDWFVDCPGIPKESDDESVGDIYFPGSNTTTFTGTGTGSRKKIEGTTESVNLFRFEKVGDNRLVYNGKKPRYFQVSSSLSFDQTNMATFIYYIAVNGTVVQQSRVLTRPDTAAGSGMQTAPIVATLWLNRNDYIEIWVERSSGTGSTNINIASLNLSIQ